MKITIECYPDDLNDAMRAALLVLLTPAAPVHLGAFGVRPDPEYTPDELKAGGTSGDDAADARLVASWNAPSIASGAAWDGIAAVLRAAILRADVVLKKGDQVTTRAGASGEVYEASPDPAVDDTYVSFEGERNQAYYPNGRYFKSSLDEHDIVSINGAPVIDPPEDI